MTSTDTINQPAPFGPPNTLAGEGYLPLIDGILRRREALDGLGLVAGAQVGVPLHHRCRAVAPLAIVGYSGMLVLKGDSEVAGYASQVRSRPPILLIHGDADDLIPVQALIHATQALAALDVPVEWHVSPGTGHGIDAEGLRHGGEFLARRLKSRVTP